MSRSEEVLMKSISNIVRKENGIALDKVISKKILDELLISDRIKQIKAEREGNGWQPLLEIEKVLKRIFEMIPIIPLNT